MLPLHVAVTMLAVDAEDPDSGMMHFIESAFRISTPVDSNPEYVPAEQRVHADRPVRGQEGRT